ncbi:hypothetical protein C0993_003750 [Termitomyces sp. T159_Od127]|nr:hypothetical protein C0993_003750 [Termitomyces sp. T159_Od127]
MSDTTTTPPPPPTNDPRLAALRALFPNYDDLVLSSVLDSVHGDQDRAIDALLGMSDPEYKPDPAAPLPQTELDEQFARRLLLEEQDAQQAAWIAQQEHARPRRQPHDATGSGSDTMADLQQHIGRVAETGKKTFNSLLNKVKAKMHEIDQPRAPPSGVQQAHPPVPYATRPRTQAPPPPAQQPAYYDPNPRTPSPPAQAQGYDTTPAPALATEPSDAPPQRPLTSPPIDGGKYGLLPKRPVTLLRPGESTQMQRQHSLDDSDDGLEYAESPFEEGKK